MEWVFSHNTEANKYTILSQDNKGADDASCKIEGSCLCSHDGHDAYAAGLR